mmetsp:Transcript_99975/g.283147  ORF Transcript_99975/g.283147 Transcript_99975/m.283147 type:complete len:213 (+) Transcript_99975:1580-2218(+)
MSSHAVAPGAPDCSSPSRPTNPTKASRSKPALACKPAGCRALSGRARWPRMHHHVPGAPGAGGFGRPGRHRRAGRMGSRHPSPRLCSPAAPLPHRPPSASVRPRRPCRRRPRARPHRGCGNAGQGSRGRSQASRSMRPGDSAAPWSRRAQRCRAASCAACHRKSPHHGLRAAAVGGWMRGNRRSLHCTWSRAPSLRTRSQQAEHGSRTARSR